MATAAQYGALMRSQLGVKENPPGSNQVPYSAWYGVAAPWCQMFQNWAHVRLGMTPPGYVAGTVPKGSAYTPTCADWFRRLGRWTTRPTAGALVYYDFPGDGVNRISHVGWVEEVRPDGSIVAIEGNTDSAGSRTGGQVMRKIRSSGIVGYGRLAYEEDDMALFDDVAAFERAVERAVDHIMSQGLTGDREGAIFGWASRLPRVEKGINTLLDRPSPSPADIAAAVVAALPAGSVDTAVVEAAVEEVIGRTHLAVQPEGAPS
jgi:hypothetical protein